MAAKPNTKAFEVRFAYELLKRLHANINNYYLLLAIIAWTRDASGTAWKGNNPLRIGHGRRFATVQAAAVATAQFLLSHGQYKTMIRRMRDTPGKDPAQREQALDFMTNLALTNWDAQHFGVAQRIDPPGHWVPGTDPGSPREWVDPEAYYVADVALASQNRLLEIINKLVGHPITLPAEPSKPVKTKTTTKRVLKGLPQGEAHGHPLPDYIQPYAALGFYNARHQTIPVVPSPVG